MRRTLFLGLTCLLVACAPDIPDKPDIETYDKPTEQAIFAGGCFWCTEASFEYVEGVISVVSGFAGGETENPSYEQVASGTTEHIESVLVTYDPSVVTYRELVDYFWKQFDPTDADGSFVDRGYQYSSAIFYYTEAQRREAEASKKVLEESGIFEDPIVTPVRPATEFYAAEDYHQDYFKNNPIRYTYYRNGSGRDRFLMEVWGEDTVHGF